MTLPASGEISIGAIAAEAKGYFTSELSSKSLGERYIRLLAGVYPTPLTSISMSDFYGKAWPWTCNPNSTSWQQLDVNTIRIYWGGSLIGTFAPGPCDEYQDGPYIYYRGQVAYAPDMYWIMRLSAP